MTPDNRYVTFLRDEVLAEVGAKYNIRKDAYSRAITGSSSGGICSFNAAWQMPDQFSRVIAWIGSFTAIQWREDPANPDGGQDYPEKSYANRIATFAFGCRTAPKIRKTIASAVGRSPTFDWPND